MSLSRISVAVGLSAAAAVLVLRPAEAQSPGGAELPSDPQATCVFTPSSFAAMFANGKVTLNGAVRPANSTVNPGANTDDPCPFFQWADQMFLWVTSPGPAPVPGGKGPLTMFGPSFYTVTEPNANGIRSFIPYAPNQPVRAKARVPKRDDEGVPRPNAGSAKGASQGSSFEEGQAGTGGVLISQNNAMVYYIVSVNDVYANHRSMFPTAPTPIPASTKITFPQSAADANAVVAFAKKNGRTIRDPNALALETKSSWVELSTLPKAVQNNYIQIQAVVPTFDTSNPASWVENGEKTVTLAMVGLHVVGSTAGHGEMLWASYEHFGNAPSATFSYNSQTGMKTVAQNTNGSWLFTPNGSSGFNFQNATWTPGSINPFQPSSIAGGIGPTPVLRMAPWGSPQIDPTQPLNSPFNANILAINTEVISLNNSRINLLAPGDVRRSYFLLGNVWTNGGKAPLADSSNLRGTTQLANATLETFVQGPVTENGNGTNCFSCHSATNAPSTVPVVTVSHIYPNMLPLK